MRKICFLMDSIFSFGGVQRVTAVIAKELAKDYDVTIVTRDKQSIMDTSLYGLNEADIHYVFFNYPKVNTLKNKCIKIYSGIYKKLQPKSKWTSDLYAHSSFPSELRTSLQNVLQQGAYDVIIGVHAPLAARLATVDVNAIKIGWIHNSFEALYGNNSRYIGPELQRHYIYQFRKLDHVALLCQHDADSYHEYDPKLHPTVIYNPLTLIPGERSNGTSKRFLAVGRFSRKHKGFDLLIKAFHLFAQKIGLLTLLEKDLKRRCTKNLFPSTDWKSASYSIPSQIIFRSIIQRPKYMYSVHDGRDSGLFCLKPWPTACLWYHPICRQVWKSWETLASISKMETSKNSPSD